MIAFLYSCYLRAFEAVRQPIELELYTDEEIQRLVDRAADDYWTWG